MKQELGRLKNSRLLPGGIPHEKPFHEESRTPADHNPQEPEPTSIFYEAKEQVQGAKIEKIQGDGDEKALGIERHAKLVKNSTHNTKISAIATPLRNRINI